MDDPDLYTAHPLPANSKSIRVLDLEPAKGDSDRSICATLRVVDLENRPRFVALSYVWGTTAAPPHTISCGQYSVKVTENCWEALWHLQRDRSREDPGRNDDGSITLWIDAICINQSDHAELLGQIQLMGDIYSLATSVCIWLGKGDSRTDQALTYLKTAGFQDLLLEEGAHTYRHAPFIYIRVAMRVMVWRYIELFRHGYFSTGEF
jgi:hypothetical protein